MGGSWSMVYNARVGSDDNSPCSENEVKRFFELIQKKPFEEQYMLMCSLNMGKIFGYANNLIRSVIEEG